MSWVEAFQKQDYYKLHQYFICHDKLIKTIVRLGGPVLEVGMGSGLTLIALAQKGMKVMGVDKDDKVVVNVGDLQDRFQIRFPIGYADIFHYKLPKPCDYLISLSKQPNWKVAFSEGLLEHFGSQDIIYMLNEMARVSEYVVFEVPSEKWPDHPNSTYRHGDEIFRSYKSWKKIIKHAGLTIVARYGWGILPKHRWIQRVSPPYLFDRFGVRFATVLGFVVKK